MSKYNQDFESLKQWYIHNIPSRKKFMRSQKISDTFIALNYPNYRLWFIGQIVSLVGTWMQATAQGYLIYQITKSDAFLGYVSFANGLPILLFTLYGGVIADRIPRRRLIVITQTSMMVLAFILAALTFSNLVQPWHIIVLAFLLGTANAFETPARQSFVSEMVDRKDMTNAIALNSTMFNIGTVVGPAVAGLVYAWLGPGWCFTINGISFIAVIFALLLMKLSGILSPRSGNSAFKELKEGVIYAVQDKTIRALLVNLGVVGIFGFGLLTLLPAWSVDVLKGDVTTNGLLLSARGIGSLIGALMIAYIGSRGTRGKIWAIGYFFTPIFFIIFAFVRWVPLSLAVMVCIGWAVMAMINTTNALIQNYVPDQLRGRVMGVYSLVFMGGSPVGSLIAGTVASKIGEPVTIMLFSSLMMVIFIITFFFRPFMRTLN
jgi:predicted MFS family arabinose efflux permease